MTTSGTFGGFWDRLTYIVAEAQLLVAGLAFSLGVALLWFRPSVPGVPPIVGGIVAALLLLGPPLLTLFIVGVRKLRNRRMVSVYHINAVTDDVQKYYVAPEVWASKTVEGPNPYPINGGTDWAVRTFDHKEDLDELTVSGVWLEEVEDTKLYTSKNHMESVYGKLTESHIALQVFRDSVSEYGADIQGRLINRMAEARERGQMMDETAVKEVFADFEDKATSVGVEELPTIEDADLPGEPDEIADAALDDVDGEMGVGMSDGQQPAATDGGSE